MRLTERDYYIFKILDKIRVLDVETAVDICNFTRSNKASERLRLLERHGYLCYQTMESSKKRFYFLTQKGMNILYPPTKIKSASGKNYYKRIKPPAIPLSNAKHELICGQIMHKILKDNPELTINDIKTDRDIQRDFKSHKKYISHQPDLLINKYNIKVEIELSRKSSKRMYRNIVINGSNCIQIWIVDNESAWRNLNKFTLSNPDVVVKIFRLDEIYKHQINCKQLFNKHKKNICMYDSIQIEDSVQNKNEVAVQLKIDLDN